MKMIDADAIRYEPMLSARGNGQYVDVMVAYKDQIDDMPTIEERKTGKWIQMEVSSGRDSWKCSVCGRRARGKLKNLPYCHCGAMMEGEQT